MTSPFHDFPHTYKMKIAYDGTDYCGWQSQPHGVSIQDLIQRALKTVTRQEVPIVGAGRTDAGVHALGQVAHFRCREPVDLHRVLYSCNALLPGDIRIMSLEEAPALFHARYSATGKIYHYHLRLDRVPDPFRRRFYAAPRAHCDVDLMRQAAPLFLGKRDFSAFANEASTGAASQNPVRTLYRLDIVPEEGGVCLEFQGDGFLYKMVRNIVGTLLEISSGKRSVTSVPDLFLRQDRRQSGMAAPAQGLFLMEVLYP